MGSKDDKRWGNKRNVLDAIEFLGYRGFGGEKLNLKIDYYKNLLLHYLVILVILKWK